MSGAPYLTDGEVVLVGGGPGDSGLITVAGLQAVRDADVILTDRLAPTEVLSEARADAEIVPVGKIPRGPFTPQEQINRLLVEHAKAGRKVVRLKGGDNFVFGRGGEEWQACAGAGVPVRIIPGVTSATAAPALAGIPLTHRNETSGFVVVTGHLPPGEGDVDWALLAKTGLTLVIMMGIANLAAIADALIDGGLPADTAATAVAEAGMPDMRTLHGELGTIATLVHDAKVAAPATVVVGALARFPLQFADDHSAAESGP